MKKFTIMLLFILFAVVGMTNAQVPNWQWAKSAGGTYDETAYSVAADASGNNYMAGYFSSPTITFGSTTLTNAGSTDVFLAKLDNGTGINDLSNSLSISVFPNPAIDIVTLKTNHANNGGLEIKIYDITGTLVKPEMLKQNQRQINIRDLSNGTYIVAIKSKDLTEYQRLIIRR